MPFNNILIIGGAGFIGTYLSKELSDSGFSVTTLDKINQNSKFFIKANIEDQNQLKKIDKSFDLVIHLAAEHQDNVSPVSKYYDVNLKGTENVLQFCNLNAIKNIIFFSTQAVYGDYKEKYSEDDAPLPSNDYGKSKFLAEKLLLDWRDEERRLAIIRPSAVFGYGSIGNFNRLIEQIQSRKFIMIGNGKNIKSVCYVKNLVAYVKHCLKLLETQKLIITNYADKPDIQIKELVKVIEEASNLKKSRFRIPYILAMLVGYIFDLLSLFTSKSINITSLRIKKFCLNSILDSNIIKSTKFIPPFSFKEAIEDTLKKR